MATSLAFAIGVNLARKSPDLAYLLIKDARHKNHTNICEVLYGRQRTCEVFRLHLCCLTAKDFHSNRYLIPV